MTSAGDPSLALADVRLAALFDKRFDGDDALLRLAARRLHRARLGAELAPGVPEQLHPLVALAPSFPAPLLAHLPRGLNLMRAGDRERIVTFARSAGDRVYGLVVHDQPELVTERDAYREALRALNALLLSSCGDQRPWLFVEYACGVDPAAFVELFEALEALEAISACIDIGHIGIRRAQQVFAEQHPDVPVDELMPHDRRLPAVIDDLQHAVATALPTVLSTIRGLGAVGKPLHFHLHDGHPLWMQSRYGVRDHTSFFEAVALPFEHGGCTCVPTMYGPRGLRRIVAAAVAALPLSSLSFTLEIHPVEGRQSLGRDVDLFRHWRDQTNAWRTSYWLTVLSRSADLLREALIEAVRS